MPKSKMPSQPGVPSYDYDHTPLWVKLLAVLAFVTIGGIVLNRQFAAIIDSFWAAIR